MPIFAENYYLIELSQCYANCLLTFTILTFTFLTSQCIGVISTSEESKIKNSDLQYTRSDAISQSSLEMDLNPALSPAFPSMFTERIECGTDAPTDGKNKAKAKPKNLDSKEKTGDADNKTNTKTSDSVENPSAEKPEKPEKQEKTGAKDDAQLSASQNSKNGEDEPSKKENDDLMIQGVKELMENARIRKESSMNVSKNNDKKAPKKKKWSLKKRLTKTKQNNNKKLGKEKSKASVAK